MPDPDIGVSAIDKQARLTDEAQEQATLQVDEHYGKRHTEQRREEFSAVRKQRFYGEYPHCQLSFQY
jgi:hypothetical protein